MKLCECGCGQPTPISAYTRRSNGWVKGEPQRYCRGHYSPKTRQQIAESRRGAGTDTWRGDDAGYYLAHVRVRAARGKAADLSCVVCGGEAHQWALNHSHPAIRTETEDEYWMGLSYSLDTEAYHPLCRSCHRRADQAGGFRI